jgi:hypothetical protein
VILDPNIAPEDDAKSRGLKEWFKEKREKIGRRLSRATAPGTAKDELKDEHKHESREEEEDLYGEQLPTTGNWKESTDSPREDSLRNVAFAKHEYSDVSEPREQPSVDESGEHTEEHTKEEAEDIGHEKYDDAEEFFEFDKPPLPAIPEELRGVSNERGSRFKEEF